MHYVMSPDGKRLSNHLIKDFRTFLKLKGAYGAKQVEAQNHGYAGTPRPVAHNAPSPPLLPAIGGPPTQERQAASNNQNDGYIASKGTIRTMV
jgi:hypothetical protein